MSWIVGGILVALGIGAIGYALGALIVEITGLG